MSMRRAMSEDDPHRIDDEAELRSLVGEALPVVETKILDRLDAPTRAFPRRPCASTAGQSCHATGCCSRGSPSAAAPPRARFACGSTNAS